MTIETANAIDGGWYVCVAQNQYGTINRTIDLIVLSKQILFCTHAFLQKDSIVLNTYSFSSDFILLAKPKLSTHSDQKHSKSMLVRLGENITLMCPFENFDNFEWYKDSSVAFNNKTINIEIYNISLNDQG